MVNDVELYVTEKVKLYFLDPEICLCRKCVYVTLSHASETLNTSVSGHKRARRKLC